MGLLHLFGLARAARFSLVCTFALACASCGPHMDHQISIQPYERSMPAMPSGTVPTTGRIATVAARQAKLPSNPLPNTPENLRRGRIYYSYYCLMCHGENGDGNGPVGQSYVPKPMDLTSPEAQKLSDSRLYASMLSGIGHDPVMKETVLPKHRWSIVLYLRTLPRSSSVPGQ